MKTIKDVLRSFRSELKDLYNSREAESIAALVLEDLTEMSRSKLKAFEDDDVPAEALEKISPILDELKTGKPVQYILGTAEFYGLSFLVNAATLIPRPETEELVEWILLSQKSEVESRKSLRILDIGTGSGCIAITLKKHLPDFEVSAMDISADAIATAKRNAVINQVQVNFMLADVLSLKPEDLDQQFDIIVSNPPYVTPADKLQMHTNVTDFEPHTALFVPADDPLLFYKAIGDIAQKQLVPGGQLYFEINEAFGQETAELLIDKGFTNVEVKKDLIGRDRMVSGTR